MESTEGTGGPIFFDAGLFIGALLAGAPRHSEAKSIVEAARAGQIPAVTSTGVLCEVYAALTWVGSQPRHAPAEAANVVRMIVQPPSAIRVLPSDVGVVQRAIDLAAKHGLNARHVHDAHHAAVSLVAGIARVYTYDVADWSVFSEDGLIIAGPPSSVAGLSRHH